MILFADLRVRLYVLSSEAFLALDYLSKNNKFKHFSIVAAVGSEYSQKKYPATAESTRFRRILLSLEHMQSILTLIWVA